MNYQDKLIFERTSDVSLEGTFKTKNEAESWIDQCIVRWNWAFSFENINKDEDNPNWHVDAHRTSGQIHNKTFSSYTKNDNDVPLHPYVEVVKETTDAGSVVFRIVNKY